MSTGATPQNEVASSSGAAASGGGSSLKSANSLTPALATEVIDVDAEKKALPAILPAPVLNSLTGDVYELPPEKIKAVDGFTVPAGFRRGGTREASFMYSIGVYVQLSTRRRRPADNQNGTLPFEQRIKTKIK